MSKQFQFKVSVVAAAISMMAGGAFATPLAGNTLVGPAITSGTATVNIDQVGVGNVVSGNGEVGGGAFIVNTASGTLNLTIQQVGAAGTSGANTLGLAAYTNAATKIRVFQGGETAGPGGTTGVVGVANSTDIGVDGVSTGNTAAITLGSIDHRSGASEILVSQQGANNVAALTLGSTAFTGVMEVGQYGTANNASVTISNQSAAKNFNILQAGDSNTLLLTAVDMGGNVAVNFGSYHPYYGQISSNNNASAYKYSTGYGVTGSDVAGINLGSTAGFELDANYGGNNVQVDLSAASTSSKVGVQLYNGSTLAINGISANGVSSIINVGGDVRVSVDGNTLAVYADGGVNGNASSVSVNDVNFNGNGYFSATSGSDISVTGGEVRSGGMSILQTGAAHQATIVGAYRSADWKITQSGTVGVDTAELTNNAYFANWTVAQSGTGAMTLAMTNATQGGVINVSQSGAANQSATGINFAAAVNSTFTLVQR